LEVEALRMVRTIGVAYPANQAQKRPYLELLETCQQAAD